ncbi:hypothetical protein GCM10027580_08490 [Corynebacterium faecale]
MGCHTGVNDRDGDVPTRGDPVGLLQGLGQLLILGMHRRIHRHHPGAVQGFNLPLGVGSGYCRSTGSTGDTHPQKDKEAGGEQQK